MSSIPTASSLNGPTTKRWPKSELQWVAVGVYQIRSKMSDMSVGHSFGLPRIPTGKQCPN